MSKFLKFLSILIGISTLIFLYPNVQSETILAMYNGQEFSMNLFALLCIVFIAGILSGLFYVCSFYLPVQQKMKEYKRKLEKTSISSDEDSSKVEVLEAKIATLEKALQSALDNNN